MIEEPKQKRKRRSLASILYQKLKHKPATKEEIEQLKLEYEKARLKAAIKKTKQSTKKNPFESKTPTTKIIYRDSKRNKKHKTKTLEEISGSNESHKYDALLGTKRVSMW